MADTVNLGRCVQRPEDLDWTDAPDEVVLEGIAAGMEPALAEGRRRWPRDA